MRLYNFNLKFLGSRQSNRYNLRTNLEIDRCGTVSTMPHYFLSLTERLGLVKTTIEYGDEIIRIEVTDEVVKFLESDRKRQQAQDRSDRRHLSKGTFEKDRVESQRMSAFRDETLFKVIHKMDLDKLRFCLRILSEPERMLIEKYYFENYNMETIGEYFGISKMAVSKRHKNIIKKLRKLMET